MTTPPPPSVIQYDECGEWRQVFFSVNNVEELSDPLQYINSNEKTLFRKKAEQTFEVEKEEQNLCVFEYIKDETNPSQPIYRAYTFMHFQLTLNKIERPTRSKRTSYTISTTLKAYKERGEALRGTNAGLVFRAQKIFYTALQESNQFKDKEIENVSFSNEISAKLFPFEPHKHRTYIQISEIVDIEEKDQKELEQERKERQGKKMNAKETKKNKGTKKTIKAPLTKIGQACKSLITLLEDNILSLKERCDEDPSISEIYNQVESKLTGKDKEIKNIQMLPFKTEDETINSDRALLGKGDCKMCMQENHPVSLVGKKYFQYFLKWEKHRCLANFKERRFFFTGDMIKEEGKNNYFPWMVQLKVSYEGKKITFRIATVCADYRAKARGVSKKMFVAISKILPFFKGLEGDYEFQNQLEFTSPGLYSLYNHLGFTLENARSTAELNETINFDETIKKFFTLSNELDKTKTKCPKNLQGLVLFLRNEYFQDEIDLREGGTDYSLGNLHAHSLYGNNKKDFYPISNLATEWHKRLITDKIPKLKKDQMYEHFFDIDAKRYVVNHYLNAAFKTFESLKEKEKGADTFTLTNDVMVDKIKISHKEYIKKAKSDTEKTTVAVFLDMCLEALEQNKQNLLKLLGDTQKTEKIRTKLRQGFLQGLLGDFLSDAYSYFDRKKKSAKYLQFLKKIKIEPKNDFIVCMFETGVLDPKEGWMVMKSKTMNSFDDARAECAKRTGEKRTEKAKGSPGLYESYVIETNGGTNPFSFYFSYHK